MIRLNLFGRYAALIAVMVSALVALTGLVHFQFARQELLEHLESLQTEKAASAANRIERFVLDIDRQLGWIDTPRTASMADVLAVRIEAIRLMRQLPALSSLSWIGPDGLERLHVSRIELDRLGSQRDMSGDPVFQAAAGGKSVFGTPYFFADSEPSMSLARPVPGGGVLKAELNLKFIWDVVARLSPGESGSAYVIAADGSLLAHLDLAAVLAKAPVAELPQIAAARAGKRQLFGRTLSGEEVISAHATIPSLNWTVFIDTPKRDYQNALDAAIRQALGLLVVSLLAAVATGFLLARTLVRPLRTLQQGAERIGGGNFDQPIVIDSGDEVAHLAAQFNRMARDLKASYAQLESKVAERTDALAREKERSLALLENMLPPDIAEELIRNGRVQAIRHDSATVLFTDFAGFTQAASTMPPDVMVAELNDIFAAFDRITESNGVDRIKTIGDAYMAAAGVSGDCPDHARRCVRAALEMVAFLAERNRASAFKWQLRVGIHSGPVVAGVVGTRKFAFDVWGDTVNLASRMESAGEAGRINVSAYTAHLVQPDYECAYRGKIGVKGKGEIDMYFIVGERSR